MLVSPRHDRLDPEQASDVSGRVRARGGVRDGRRGRSGAATRPTPSGRGATPNLDWLRDERPRRRWGPTARRSACPPTTTWATARSATTRSARAGSSTRAPSWSTRRSPTGALFEGEVWQRAGRARARARRAAALHRAALRRQRPQPHRPPPRDARGARRGRRRRACACTSLLDGRDVPETSALELRRAARGSCSPSIAPTPAATTASPPAAAACCVTMDRYEADWRMVERGWNDPRARRGPRASPAPREAIETFRAEDPGVIDQFLPAFVDRRRRRARSGPIARRRRGGLLQLPRRPRDRDQPRLRGATTSTSSTAARAPTCSTPA